MWGLLPGHRHSAVSWSSDLERVPTPSPRPARSPVYTQQTQNICITFIQCWTNVEDVGPTLYKCYTNVLCSRWTGAGRSPCQNALICRRKEVFMKKGLRMSACVFLHLEECLVLEINDLLLLRRCRVLAPSVGPLCVQESFQTIPEKCDSVDIAFGQRRCPCLLVLLVLATVASQPAAIASLKPLSGSEIGESMTSPRPLTTPDAPHRVATRSSECETEATQTRHVDNRDGGRLYVKAYRTPSNENNRLLGICLSGTLSLPGRLLQPRVLSLGCIKYLTLTSIRMRGQHI